MTIKDAIKQYNEKYPDQKISIIYDIGNEWLIGDEEDDSDFSYMPPIIIDKITGKMKAFFPHNYGGNIKNAIPISIDEIE